MVYANVKMKLCVGYDNFVSRFSCSCVHLRAGVEAKWLNSNCCRSKGNPVQACTDPEASSRLRLPYFKTIST
jgi:hypothetical protein